MNLLPLFICRSSLSINRRHFLQLGAASLVTALGLSQANFFYRADRYAQVLSQNTSRKRALLVGINRYADPRWIPLNGAENDAKLQREVLIHCFGFESDAIVTLTNEQATRENILNQFEEHLLRWAQPGDVAVFHFSGHGSQVADPDQVFSDGRVSTIVPIDGALPLGYPNKGGRVNDITGHTLWLLMKTINTDNITVVLDSCHSGGARKGLLTVRARPGDLELLRGQDPTLRLLANHQEEKYQEQLLAAAKLSRTEFAAQRQQGVPKGVLLAASRADQSAIDASFAGTPAGIFTYVLTRYLWLQAGEDSVNQMIASTATTMQRILQEYFPTAGLIQQPEFNARQGSDSLPETLRDRASQRVYFTNRRNPSAEAIVTGVQGNQVNLFLGGIDPRSLEAFGKGATFVLPDGRGQVRVESRDQFTAKGVWVSEGRATIAPGTFLQERSRAIPSDLTLRIGLDPSLGQELESARQTLKAINKRIEPVSIQQQDVHYLLGRVTQDYGQQLQKLNLKKLPAVGSVALFSPAADLILGSDGSASEQVTDAVNRLKPKLKSLLAARLVKLTLNPSASKLSVAAAMEVVDGGTIQAEAFTVRGTTVATVSRSRGQATRSANAQRVTTGTVVRFLIQNHEPRDLYYTVLLISVDGELSVLSPLPGNEEAAPIPAGQQIQVPDLDRGELYRFRIAGEPGVAEVLVIVSTSPMKRAIALLQNLAAESDRKRGTPVNLNQEPDGAIASLLQDLDEGTRGSGTTAIPGIQQIDTQQMAALSITLEVVA